MRIQLCVFLFVFLFHPLRIQEGSCIFADPGVQLSGRVTISIFLSDSRFAFFCFAKLARFYVLVFNICFLVEISIAVIGYR